jgi:ribosome-associated protein
MRDIVVVPTHKLGLKHLKEHSILASGFASRHIYKVAKQFSVDLKALDIPDLPHPPRVHGRRDDEWLIVEIGEISVHFMVDTLRKDHDLVDLWVNPIEQEYYDFNRRVEDMFYGKKKR